jgi:23S rRNA (guanosine2251-2'-O)-methyltransferase
LNTICPYPDCRHEHIWEDTDQRQSVCCPACERIGSRKPAEFWQQMERLVERRKGLGDRSVEKQSQVVAAILEDVRSLWNVGSILRTCDGAGISTVYLCGITGCPPRTEILKTSLGAEEHLAWHYAMHPLDVIPQLQKSGVHVVGLERNSNSSPIKDFKITPSQALALVVGNEVTGISRETLSLCDSINHLPMTGHKESLNVAVAFGIAAYALNSHI